MMHTIVNVLYFLYFENRELVYHYERVWSEDGMSSTDNEYAYVFCGIHAPSFDIDLETYDFLYETGLIEQTGGSNNERTYMLSDYYRTYMTTFFNDKKRTHEKTALE